MNILTPATHLLLVILLPLAGSVVAWLMGSRGYRAVRQSAAITAVVTLVATGWLVFRFLEPSTARTDSFARVEIPWLVDGMFDIRLSLGLDGLSIWLFALSALLSLTAVLVSWDAIKEKSVGFYVLLLLLESAMLGVFAAQDIILFYVFFEFTLVPLFFLIGIWGHEERRNGQRLQSQPLHTNEA